MKRGATGKHFRQVWGSETIQYFQHQNDFLEALRHKRLRVFHFLQSDMFFGIVNRFSEYLIPELCYDIVHTVST